MLVCVHFISMPYVFFACTVTQKLFLVVKVHWQRKIITDVQLLVLSKYYVIFITFARFIFVFKNGENWCFSFDLVTFFYIICITYIMSRYASLRKAVSGYFI